MKKLTITLVIDQYGEVTNGTTVTARRLAKMLEEKGHNVRILTSSNIKADNVFVVKPINFPIAKQIIRSQGMQLAIPNKKIMKKAFEGSDIIHFLMPFFLGKSGKKLADKMNIPSSSAFHVQPENITYTIGLGKLQCINNYIYKNFKKFFDKFDHIHCPSEMIKNELEIRNYKSKKHVISNGVTSTFQPKQTEKPENLKDKFIIMMTARLSKEKRQDVLIRAVAESKYKDKIQLVFCGKGPWGKYLSKLDAKLSTNPSIFKFCSQEELIDTINYSDLYVHSSDIDIEAIGCIEAFSCGLVPIISNNKLVATKQFALSENCLFESGKPNDLAKKIDFMFENPDEMKKLKQMYIESANQYKINSCVEQMENMFNQTIEDFKKKQKLVAKLETQKPVEYENTLFQTIKNEENDEVSAEKNEELETKVII